MTLPSTPQTLPAEDVVGPRPVLQPKDRCDACSAAAMERWENGQFELLFCKHHAAVHAEGLFTASWVRTESWAFVRENLAGTVGLKRVRQV
ncbi:hypothetical protein PBI_PATTYP_78 [Mycobacterium phage PattyP]|uniref:hypothetical protein n=1 Tax=Mycobacterium phage PattyP TaxID=1327773 RepID=UPI00032B593B|nr:hypothetical protein PBI_PATTYP_78 [Mycobacterium phage PattyP]AGK87365.1 hypothetical protein PBI_PATTYP_78 [Mycobacterium phage PattyP]AXH69408.1 hypothetical protein SEA_NEHALO_74 [Mycobacterium phage NEHalo]